MLTDHKNEYFSHFLKFTCQRIAKRCLPRVVVTVAMACTLFWCTGSRAQFETVIDSPPAEFERNGRIDSNTQLNLYPGGVLPAYYRIGPTWEPGDNIEINLLGGSVGSEGDYGTLRTSSSWVRTTNVTVNLVEGTVWGDVEGTAGALITLNNAAVKGRVAVYDGALAVVTGGEIAESLSARGGSMVQVSGGTVGPSQRYSFYDSGAHSGSVFLMSGGVINTSFNVSDSYASITGGRIENRISVQAAGQLDIAGGSLGSINSYGGGTTTLIGGEFELDGVPIAGLTASAQDIDFPTGGVLTGVLSDGSPVILANDDSGVFRDYFPDELIALRQTLVPEIDQQVFDAPDDVVPSGLRTGQSLTLGPDSFAPANFTALPDSSVSIVGGEIGHGFEAAGASVTLSSGSIGQQGTIYHGTTLKVTGGEIGSNFELTAGSRLEMEGGVIGQVGVAHPHSEVIYSGGKIRSWFRAETDSSFTINGGEFRLDGVPIAALATPGDSQQIDLPEGGVLSGTLSDGTSFSFGPNGQWFAPGTLTLQSTDVPAAGPAIIGLPGDPVPKGLRAGQTLLLTEGGELGNQFTADWGSVVRMSGGRIGYDFETVGSFVSVTGGSIGGIDAMLGSVVNINGGTVEGHVAVHRGAIVNLSAGEIRHSMGVYRGGRVSISGDSQVGWLNLYGGGASISGGTINNGIALYDGSSLTMTGGKTGEEISAYGNSRIEISGGQLGDGLYVSEGAQVLLRGSDVRIDGEPIDGDSLSSLFGSTHEIDIPLRSVLSGVFSDGTPFAFTSSDGDTFSPGTLTVASGWRPFLPGISIGFPRPVPQEGLRPGEELMLMNGDQVGSNFTAGWDGELTVAGGEIGDNFEAVGAVVNIVDGTIGNGMDAMFGTEVNLTGGVIGYDFEAHRGSVVNIVGGSIPEIVTRAGSVVNISGGRLGEYYEGEFYYNGDIDVELGSELHVTGTDFYLDGNPIEGLEPGESVMLEWDDQSYLSFSLQANLQDGSPFKTWVDRLSYGRVDDLQAGDVFTLRLTAALPGDFDGNELVDAADLAKWQTRFGENGGGSSFLGWQREFGTPNATSAQTQVPEPASWLMLAVMFAAVFSLAQRNQS